VTVLGRTRAIHCVGVGGSGVSAIAEVLLRLGYTVSGSDARPSSTTDRLAALGLDFHPGHDASHVGSVDVVVISSAVRPTNVEVGEARRRGIPVVLRAEMLAEIMRARFSIAVAGAHGKTTTSSMIAVMLADAGLDPTAIIGARIPAFGSNARVGRSEYLVAEADESDRSFLRLPATMTVVTNIDYEHLERYHGFPDLVDAFVAFAGKPPFYGASVLCLDDEHVRAIAQRVTARTVTYGIDRTDAAIGARDLAVSAQGSRATIVRRHTGGEETLGTLRLAVPGRHNLQNALAAVAVGLELGVPFDTVAAGLARFEGVERRFERKGEAAGVEVFDDYGHHPAEIAAVLRAARTGRSGRIVVAFQPHRYSRTKQLRDEFGPALALADVIVLTDIYAAGEDPVPGVSVEWLAEAVAAAAPGRVDLVPRLADVPEAVARVAHAGDFVITLGAGSIGECGDRILEELRRCR
jgi:UDP-N-acetylmuramate--alanine ligase